MLMLSGNSGRTGGETVTTGLLWILVTTGPSERSEGTHPCDHPEAQHSGESPGIGAKLGSAFVFYKGNDDALQPQLLQGLQWRPLTIRPCRRGCVH